MLCAQYVSVFGMYTVLWIIRCAVALISMEFGDSLHEWDDDRKQTAIMMRNWMEHTRYPVFWAKHDEEKKNTRQKPNKMDRKIRYGRSKNYGHLIIWRNEGCFILPLFLFLICSTQEYTQEKLIAIFHLTEIYCRPSIQFYEFSCIHSCSTFLYLHLIPLAFSQFFLCDFSFFP